MSISFEGKRYGLSYFQLKYHKYLASHKLYRLTKRQIKNVISVKINLYKHKFYGEMEPVLMDELEMLFIEANSRGMRFPLIWRLFEEN